MRSLNITPWWQSLKLRSEVINSAGQIDDVQMSLFRALHGAGTLRPPYADAPYYGDITYPTERLVALLAEVAIRLGGGHDYPKAPALRRLDQGMGGGKSHACIGALHLARSPEALSKTDLGKAVFAKARTILGRELPTDLGGPQVVVLPCDNMTPGAPVQEYDGPAFNLYERFLWRLFSKDYALFERYQPYFNDKSKIVEALRAVNRPVLIVIDEIMDYCGNGLDGARNPNLAAQDMAFLRALFDVCNDVPNVVMIVVMIGSDTMALGTEAARERRTDLHSLLERNGTPATVTANADFAEILRRRLFDRSPVAEVVAATAAAFASVLADKAWSRSVWETLNAHWVKDFESEVVRTYPFHPMLISLAEQEWAQVAGFQRVRSTIRIFAATVYALQLRGKDGHWVPTLIGPGDLPLSDNNVREAILGSGLVGDDRTIANFRALAENEVVNQDDTGGAARRLDLTRVPLMWTDANPRAAERGATMIFLTSIVGARPGGRRGASAPEVKAATSVPNSSYVLADADGVVEDLVNQDLGMSAVEVIPGQGNNKPARYYLSTKLTYRMLVNNLRKTITDGERDQALAEWAERLSNTGPFKRRLFVRADLSRPPAQVLATAGLDDARTTRLVVLDAAQFSLRNGMERETLVALHAALGLAMGSKDRLPVEWASSAVYAVVNTQRRTLARALATEYLARQRALATPEIQSDADLTLTGNRELAQAKEKLEKAVKRAYQHVVYLAQPDLDSERTLDQITFDDDNQTALDGTLVWKALVEREKAFDNGQFTGNALIHNLRPSDYQRPLSEIRDAFWSAPRLPLLYLGERDLQLAICQAVQAGNLRITDAAGNSVAVTDPTQVNLASMGLRLAPPASTESAGEHTQESDDGDASGFYPPPVEGGQQTPGGEPTPSPVGVPIPAEKYVTFPLVGNLLNTSSRVEDLAQVFRTLYAILDDNKVSYAQGTLQFVMEAEAADRLAECVRILGVNVTVRDQ